MKISRLTAAASAVSLGCIIAAPAAALASTVPMRCSAWMSASNPDDYTTTDVHVHTASRAYVTTVAHYRTTSTKHHAYAGRKGNATIAYYISGAKPGYKVKVTVTAVSGSRIASCATSFTPER